MAIWIGWVWFPTVPESNVRLEPWRLCFYFSWLCELPADVFMIRNLQLLEMRNVTTLTALPELSQPYPSNTELKTIRMQFPAVEDLPRWMKTGNFLSEVDVWPKGTPLCKVSQTPTQFILCAEEWIVRATIATLCCNDRSPPEQQGCVNPIMKRACLTTSSAFTACVLPISK